MNASVSREVAALSRMTVKQLKRKFAEVFGEAPSGNHRTWLVRRIAWRVQALAEGGLSERAKARAAELANEADLRLNPPGSGDRVVAPEPATERATGTAPLAPTDSRLPPPGTVLTRTYKGTEVQVQVLATGFEYAGEVYGSLSAAAKAVTGSHCNGFHFFRLNKDGAA